MSKFGGFGLHLTDLEKSLIQAFDENGELVMPTYTLRGLNTREQMFQVLKSLEDKKIIVRGKPYKLSKLGHRLKKNNDG